MPPARSPKAPTTPTAAPRSAPARRAPATKPTKRPVRRAAPVVRVTRRAPEPARPQRAAAARPAPRPAATAPAPTAPHDAISRQAPTYRRALLRCKHYDRAEPVRLALTVRPDGTVASVAVERARAGRVDHACLRESAQRFRFAPFSGAPATVAVDFRL